MSLVFYHDNLAKTASLTASSENAQFPVASIKDDRRTKVFRSTSNSDNVVFDLGSAQNVDAVCIAPDWRNGFGFSAITIEANTSDSWGAPAFSQAFSFDSTHGTGITEFSSTQSYRYWRLVITSTLGYCELGNVFIGPKLDITTNGINEGIVFQNNDIVKASTTEYGQEFYDDIAQRKEITGLAYNTMNTSEITQFFTIVDNVRTINPFWVRFKNLDSVLDDADRWGGIYKFTRVPKVTLNSGGFFNVPFQLKEQK